MTAADVPPQSIGASRNFASRLVNVHLQYVFMDMETYEEQRLEKDDAWAKWLTEGMNVQLVIWEGKVISVDVPKSVELVITQSEPGVKGNTAAGEPLLPSSLTNVNSSDIHACTG